VMRNLNVDSLGKELRLLSCSPDLKFSNYTIFEVDIPFLAL
jgi:hypothetical protein